MNVSELVDKPLKAKVYSGGCARKYMEIFKKKNRVIAYTDGACKGNPGIGGWGAILSYNGVDKEIYGSEKDTTNNRMELMAAIKTLQALKRKCDITIYTDSKYLQNGINEWLANWKANGWKTAAKKEVKIKISGKSLIV